MKAKRYVSVVIAATTKLLATCKVLMRDRRGIELLLTPQVRTFEPH